MKKNIKWVVLGLLIIAFLTLTYLVLNNKTILFDNFIYKIIAKNQSDFKTTVYKCITFFGSTKFITVLTLMLLIIFYKNKNGVFISIGIIISTLLNNILKIIIKRSRPIHLMLVNEKSFSFPSGHTMAAVTIYGLLIYLIWKSEFEKKLKIFLSILLIFLTISIGISRIYLGAHYASDVLGAIIASTIWLITYISFIKNKKLI